MRGPDPAWDHKQKPDCSDSYAPVVVDSLTASASASLAAQLAFDDKVQTPVEVPLAAVGVALLYTVSARIGAGLYTDCRNATAEWHAFEAIRQRDATVAAARARETGPGSPGAPVPRTAFFCNVSATPALEICAGDRAVCEHARRVVSRRDSDGCVARDTAWCFGVDDATRCFATRPGCEAQLTRASAISSACTERH